MSVMKVMMIKMTMTIGINPSIDVNIKNNNDMLMLRILLSLLSFFVLMIIMITKSIERMRKTERHTDISINRHREREMKQTAI